MLQKLSWLARQEQLTAFDISTVSNITATEGVAAEQILRPGCLIPVG